MSLIALDPKEVFELTLEDEAHLPASQRAVFVSRYLTARQSAEFDRLTDQATPPWERLKVINSRQKVLREKLATIDPTGHAILEEIPDYKAATEELAELQAEVKLIVPTPEREMELLLQALSLGHVSCKPINQAAAEGGPDPRSLADLLTLAQLWDLVNHVGPVQKISEKQRKKSALQSASAAAATSAGSAGTGV